MHNSLAALALAALVQSGKAAIGPTATLNIVNANVSPDGFERAAVLANSVYPAPLITSTLGDTFTLTVNDQLTDTTMERATSIHWHGMFQNGTNSEDGVSFVTQCPIIPDNSYTYHFTPTGQTGTYWYHSHLNTQYCDGLRGPLVIYDPADPHASLYDVDDDNTVITLSDWYHTSALALAGTFPNPDATLINGLGRYSGGPLSPLAVVSVTAGQRYRMRLVAIACHPNWVFTIDQHVFTIIEADGQNTQLLNVDTITIYAGQRYSFILNANQTVDNYWIRAVPNIGNTTTSGGMNSAILRYSGAPVADPTSSPTISSTLGLNTLQEWNLHALTNPAAPGNATLGFLGGADVNINLALAFTGTTYTINGESFIPPSVPVLLQILSGAQTATDLLPAGSVYVLPKNKVIELTIPSSVALGGPHPFHLHGHAFSVIRSAGSLTYNYANPVRRDVVNVGPAIGGTIGIDNVTIRFVTDNAGPWFLHCHIDWHLQAGLAVVFAEDPADVASHNPVSTAWSDLCPDYNAWGST